MRIYAQGCFFLLTMLLWCSGCKKDLIKAEKIVTLNTHTTDRLNNIQFVNDTLGFIVGGQRFYSSTILRTTDGGNHWEFFSLPEAGKGLYGITIAPGGMLYACGFDSKLLYSPDQGNNWIFAQITNWQPFKNIAYTSANTGIVVGGISFNYGSITRIDDKGNIIKFDTTNYELNDIDMVTTTTGYIVGMGVVLKTIDAGVNWKFLDIKNDDFTAMSDFNKTELWVCGYGGSIFHSTDAGESWERLRNGNDITSPHYRLLHIVFKDALHGWAVGEEGLIIYTDDGGHHWMEYDRFTHVTLRRAAFTSDGGLLVVGDEGIALKIQLK
jgi:photosystem II stability/assembly factor-like uncharacterized protein